MQNVILAVQKEITWFLSLEKADMLGVIAFIFSAILLLIYIIRFFVWLIRKLVKPGLDLEFRLEDVRYETFKKKGFVTYDLYVQNHGHHPVEVIRAGVVLADGSKRTIYQEPHVLKEPDKKLLNPGEEAFYNDCDLYYTLNEKTPYFKKITGFFVDVKGNRRYSAEADIHALMNDQTVREVLTDNKGMNGF